MEPAKKILSVAAKKYSSKLDVFRSLIRIFEPMKAIVLYGAEHYNQITRDDMKNKASCIFGILCFVLLFMSCEKIEPERYDKEANGAYFDYDYATDFDRMVNFADHIVGNPDTVTVALKVKLLGYLKEEGRTLAVKTRAIEGCELADVVIEEVMFASNEYEKVVEVKVCRPKVEDVLYAVCIYLDGSGDIGAGIKGKDEINLYVTESYEQPIVWDSHVSTYLGEWERAKHIFLAQHTGDDHFYLRLYDEELGIHLYDSIIALNVSAVNALLAHKPADSISIDLPILKESDYPDYSEPYFWNNHESLLGMYRAGKFCRFVLMMGGSGTRDVATLFASEAARLKMEEVAGDFHKDDVLYMLNEYYAYARMGYPIAECKDLCWVEMKSDVNYTVRIPYWWEDPHGLGTAGIVKRYFGEYADDKYQFMLKTIMKEDGVEHFVAASLFPFIYDKTTGTYVWDNSPLGTRQLAGEARLKECYRLIKAANDRRPASRRFDIPEVEL